MFMMDCSTEYVTRYDAMDGVSFPNIESQLHCQLSEAVQTIVGAKLMMETITAKLAADNTKTSVDRRSKRIFAKGLSQKFVQYVDMLFIPLRFLTDYQKKYAIKSRCARYVAKNILVTSRSQVVVSRKHIVSVHLKLLTSQMSAKVNLVQHRQQDENLRKTLKSWTRARNGSLAVEELQKIYCLTFQKKNAAFRITRRVQ